MFYTNYTCIGSTTEPTEDGIKFSNVGRVTGSLCKNSLTFATFIEYNMGILPTCLGREGVIVFSHQII